MTNKSLILMLCTAVSCSSAWCGLCAAVGVNVFSQVAGIVALGSLIGRSWAQTD